MNTQKLKENIIKALYEKSISEKSMAEAIGLSPQALHYALHTSSTFDLSLYESIKSFLKARGVILDKQENIIQKCSNYSIEFSSTTNQMLNILGKILREITAGRELAEYEKEVLKGQLRNFQKDFNSTIMELIKVIDES